jgi:septal ring factor EnvC (AmiA/AmiB activator)
MIRRECKGRRQPSAVHGWRMASLTGLWILTSWLLPAAAIAADPDWPCQQRLVPDIAAAMIWSGPPLDSTATAADDPEIRHLAGNLAARRTPLEQATAEIDQFARGLPAGHKNEQLTRLFAETLAILNHDRSSIIGGIKKYAHGQEALAQRISATNEKLAQLAIDQAQERDALAAQREWDMRIYSDRRSSLSYLCEQPVLLEKRAFTLARAIAAHLE